MSPYDRQSLKGQFGPLTVASTPERPLVCVTVLGGLSVLVVSASSGALRVELHVAYDPATSTMGGRVVTSTPSRGERRERSLRPRSCRWLLEEFFAGRLDPAWMADL